MSWQQYIDESLLGTSQVAKASIHGLDGQRYASSAGFVVSKSSLCKQVNLSNKTRNSLKNVLYHFN